jgi:anti-sigma factor RsiW
MKLRRHNRRSLGAYALGALEAHEEHAIERHVATCDDCFNQLTQLLEVRSVLNQVPPEAFLDGPPDSRESPIA